MIRWESDGAHIDNVEDDLAELIKAENTSEVGVFFEPLPSQEPTKEQYLLKDGTPNVDAIREGLDERGYKIRVYIPDSKRPSFIKIEKL